MGKKNKKYTQEQIAFVTNLVNSGNSVAESTRQMCVHFNLTYDENIGRRFRDKMQKLSVTTNTVDQEVEESDELKLAKAKEFDSSKTKVVVGWCQSNTELHKNLFNNMLAYADYHDAAMHIIAGRYKNPSSLELSKELSNSEKNHKKMHWPAEIQPYLDAARHKIHKHLCILSDVKIQPTASTPLSGLNGITGLESCIIGHPRMHLRSLPVLDGYPHKLLLSTGAISVENYTDTKAGKKGEFHHQYGFIFVELDGDEFHIRQISADENGNFYDLCYEVKNGVVKHNSKSVKALVFGDLHIGEEDEVAVKSAFKMAQMLKPKEIILHDVFNGHSISHHEKKDPFQLLRRERDGSWSLKRELKEMKKWFDKHTGYDYVTVRSNHDDFLDRWLMGNDWRTSVNRAEYLKYASILANGKAPKGIIPYVLTKNFKNVKPLGLDDSHRVGDVELGIHGHIGASGTRGSVIQFKNMNTKTITGHTHSPVREDGHMSVGTLTKLRVGYNHGASSWMHSNIVIYPNGKTSHIHIINGKFTTFDVTKGME